ncbi:hypothetical protein [Aldersonia kunmingensis]|uniref:hypothetical protein n=1 Tax=Aldersonia kunmingensis TaxID=408066 RepID=UPI000831C252|nr:hypothetical protein [Aldersonia kunmingensis]
MMPARNGDSARVAKALEGLPPDARRAVVLAYYRTLTTPDLSHLLASDAPRVHRDLHRGAQELLAAIRAEAPTPTSSPEPLTPIDRDRSKPMPPKVFH